jgi:hypothetical protein
MARKLATLCLLALLALPLGGCYTMGYMTGKTVGILVPPPMRLK